MTTIWKGYPHLTPLQEKKDPFKHVFKWAKDNNVDVELVRDVLKTKKRKNKLSFPRIRFRSPRLSDSI